MVFNYRRLQARDVRLMGVPGTGAGLTEAPIGHNLVAKRCNLRYFYSVIRTK
jgi:hypothetical protein